MNTLPIKESLQIEFKRAVKPLKDEIIIEAVVALSNTEGGTLYLGLEDDGRITGVNHKQADAIGVAALIANMTVPSVSVRARLLSDHKLPVLEIKVPKSKLIISSSNGKMLRRRLKLDGTPENVPMFAHEINSRLSDLSALDYSEHPVLESSYDDLDPTERVRLKKLIRQQRGDQHLLELSDVELDKALRLVKEENGQLIPTFLGLLLIGKEGRIKELIPTASATFQVLEGTQIRLNEQYHLPLLALFEQFNAFFQAWNPEHEIEVGMFRMPIPEFSDSAFREALVNAFCHRDYTILQGVRVLINDESLSISSPGGFIDGVSLQNLLTVEPMGRNRALADALKRIGLAEKTGRGIDRIFEGSIVYGRPWPDYTESTARCIKLMIPRSQADLAFTQMISREENRSGKTLSIQSLLALSILQNERRVDLDRIVALSHIQKHSMRVTMEHLIERGLVESMGSGAARFYILSSKVYRGSNNSIAYVLQTGIDSIKNEELCLKLAKEQAGWINRNDVVRLLNLSDAQAYRHLKKMTQKGLFTVEGRGRATRYRLLSHE